MKNAVCRILITVSLLALVLLGFTACQLNLSPPQAVAGSALVLSLRDGVQKTLAPEISTVIASYDIQGWDVKGNTFERLGETGTTVVVNSLYADTWTVVATGKNASGQEVGAGTGTVTLVRGEVVTLAIDVVPEAGAGTLSMTLIWPAGSISSPRVVSSLTVGGVPSGDPLPFTLSEDGLSATTGTVSLEHGYYGWSLQLYDDQVQVFGAADAVRILASYPTTKRIELTTDTMNRAIGDVQVSVTPKMDNPIGIVLSGAQSSLLAGSTMVVTATPGEGVDWYQWYLNGVAISGASTSSVTVGAGLKAGYYQLTVMVGKGSVLSGATAEFTVVPSWQTFGSFGDGLKQFSAPHGIALDSSGRIYVADEGNNRIVRIDDMTGKGWTTYGTSGTGSGQFKWPCGVAVDASGQIYVGDYGNSRIVRMNDMSGAGWVNYGSFGGGNGNFYGAWGIAFDSIRRIYVTDYYNNRIVRMNDMTGAGWTTYGNQGGGQGQLSCPYALALDSTGRIHIADYNNQRIVRINDMTGTGWTVYGNPGVGEGQFNYPDGIAFDGLGRIYVVDDRNWRIVRMNDMTGTGWVSVGSRGSGERQFNGVSGIAIDSNGWVYVSEYGNNRIDRFSMP